MGFFGKIISKILINADHRDALNCLAMLIKECKGVSSVYECREMRKKIMEFAGTVQDEKYANIRSILADLIDYLADTCYHAEHLYHKPAHNGWKTVRTFPDINDYVKLGTKI